MFHGDIKPDNIFYQIGYIDEFLISSDSGSLVQLERGNSDIKYQINYYTPVFSSEKHITAIKNRTGETADELFQEDKH